jgi:hypothetical protein
MHHVQTEMDLECGKGIETSENGDAIAGARPGREVPEVRTNSNAKFPERERTTRFKVELALFLAVIAVAVLMLGLSMGRHRFHEGDRINRYDHLKP